MITARQVFIASSVMVDYTLFLKRCLEEQGYQVEMVSYLSEQQYRNASRRRLWKVWTRIQMYILYPVFLAWKGICAPRGSVFIVTSNTFYAPICVTLPAKAKRHVLVYLVYDLFPDAIEIAGKLLAGSVISNFIGMIVNANRRVVATTVFLGEFLRHHAETRWGTIGRSTAIDISADAELFDASPRQQTHGVLSIHYGGQFGHMHDADSAIECIRYVLSQPDIASRIHFSFRVGGAQAARLESAFKDLPVEVLPPIPSDEWRKEIRRHNVGLVSLSPGGATVCLPSKSYAMMAGGMPIIAICPEWSDLSRMVKNADAGWVVSNSPYEESELSPVNYTERINAIEGAEIVKKKFADLLRYLIENPEQVLSRSANAVRVMQTAFGHEKIGKAWQIVIENACNLNKN